MQLGGADLAAFAKDDFDSKAWINQKLRHGGVAPAEPLETTISSLVTNLQFLCHHLAESLETASEHCLSQVPRSLQEIRRVQGVAKAMQDDVHQLKGIMTKVETSNTGTGDDLGHLHDVKTRIAYCRSLLQEADNYAYRRKAIHGALSTGDVGHVADMIGAMHRSLEMLSVLNLPGHDQDVADLSTHRQLLLDSIAPRLATAIDGLLKTRAANGGRLESAEPLCELASVYFKMGQPALFASEYSRHRITRGVSAWTKFDVVTDGASYSEWLSDFLDEQCTDLVLHEIPVAMEMHKYELSLHASLEDSVLHDTSTPGAALTALITGFFTALSPTFEDRLFNVIGTRPKAARLVLLQDVCAVMQKFCADVNAGFDRQTGLSVTGDERNHVARAALSPLVPILARYPEYEGALLENQIQERVGRSLGALLESASASAMLPLGEQGSRQSVEGSVSATQSLLLSLGESVSTVFLTLSHAPTRWEIIAQTNSRLSQAIAGEKAALDSIGTSTLSAALSPVIVRYLETFHKALLVVRQVSDGVSKAAGIEEEGRLQHIGLLLLAACHQLKEEMASLAAAVHEKANSVCSAEQLSSISSLEPAMQLFPDANGLLHSLSTAVHCLFIQIVFMPVKRRLSGLKESSGWAHTPAASKHDLPSFSLSPGELVIALGEHMMHIPEQIEAHSASLAGSAGSIGLNMSFVFLQSLQLDARAGSELTLEDQEAAAFATAALQVANSDDETESDVVASPLPHFSLQCCTGVCGLTIHFLLQELLRFEGQFSQHGTKQLLADVEYLKNVMGGLSVPLAVRQSLLDLESLLSCSQGEFFHVGGTCKGREITEEVIDLLRRIRGL